MQICLNSYISFKIFIIDIDCYYTQYINIKKILPINKVKDVYYF